MEGEVIEMIKELLYKKLKKRYLLKFISDYKYNYERGTIKFEAFYIFCYFSKHCGIFNNIEKRLFTFYIKRVLADNVENIVMNSRYFWKCNELK